jgi:hypothetical protein
VSTVGVYLGLHICEAHVAGQLQQQWNAEQKTAYAFKGDQWVGYDNIAAVKIKVRPIMCNSYCGNFSTNIFQWFLIFRFPSATILCAFLIYPIVMTVIYPRATRYEYLP